MEEKGLVKTSPKSFITFREYTESQDKIKADLLRSQESVKKELTKRLEKAETQADKLDTKINGIDDKVDQVKEIVVPLTIAMNNMADNSNKLVLTLEKFTESQAVTNGLFQKELHGQAITIEGLKAIAARLTEKKTYNLGVTVAAITLVGTFIGGLVTLAPMLFNN